MKIQKADFQINKKLIENLSNHFDIIESILEYRRIVEQEETKRIAIQNKYREAVTKVHTASQIALEEIERNHQKEMALINKTYELVKKAMDQGSTEQALKVWEKLLEREGTLVSKELTLVVNSIISTDDDYLDAEILSD